MSQEDQLNNVRQQWYAAYFAGDIGKLSQLELPEFTYISVQGIEHTSTRYHTIKQRLLDKNWFPDTANRNDVSTSYQFVGDVCYVTGEGRINLTPELGHNRYMSELWQFSQQYGWQILSLHASVVPA